MRVRTVVCLLGAFSMGVVPATAQDSSRVVAFRPGQWGVLFSIESPFVSAGALRFTSPRAAWTINATADLIASSGSRDSSTGIAKSSAGAGSVFLSLGRRRYAVPRGRVVAFSGLGVTGAYSRSQQRFDAKRTTRSNYGAGAFAEFGAQVHVTPYLSLGALWPIQATVWRATSDDGTRQRSWQLSASNLRIQGGLYF